jgi:large subunit ribosomal protein L21
MEERTAYAIIRAGGKQYRVQPGDTIRVERIASPVGEEVTLDEVLLVAEGGEMRFGSPQVAGAKVLGVVVEQDRGEKIRVLKYKKRKHYRRTRGHRQYYTALRIESIAV